MGLGLEGEVAGLLPFSFVDGPGNRFVIFLQGCNFDCIACHNPWTIGSCEACGYCMAACPSGALDIAANGLLVWDERVCEGHEACIPACPNDANPRRRFFTADGLVERIREAMPFISGVTVSGGEATQQAPFVRELFEAIKADPELGHLTTFVDSNGSAPLPVWDELAPVMDAAMLDLKALDPAVHLRLTGRDNDSVLTSIRHLASIRKLHEVRLLLVPDVNDDAVQMAATGAWLAEIDRALRVVVIGFRRHGTRPAAASLGEATPEGLAGAAEVLRAHGLTNVVVV